jgi:hypothetical protein
MSNVEAGILAGTFVACLVITLVFAAVLLGMFPALACPSCASVSSKDDGGGVCCLACEWCCLRYCACCRPERLRKRLLEDVEELRRVQAQQEEDDQSDKTRAEK